MGHIIISCSCWVALEGKRNSAELIKDLGFGGSILSYPVHLLRSYSLSKGSGTHLEEAVAENTWLYFEGGGGRVCMLRSLVVTGH